MHEDEFLESFAVATALPGTPGTNLLTIIGVRQAGAIGGLLAASAFLLPSVLVMIAFGVIYGRVRNITALGIFLDGMSVATIGVVAGVAVDVGRGALKRGYAWVIAALALGALVVRALTLLEVIVLSGLFGALFLRPERGPSGVPAAKWPPTKLGSWLVPLPFVAVAASPWVALFFVFAKIGLVTFGGGFAMIPEIAHEIVATRHWLNEAAFNDAIVLGQITPGPVAIASTFIGYRVAGLGGALFATIGMFTPPLVLSLLAGRSLEAFQTNTRVQGALRGITPAMVGILAAAAVALWRTSVHGITAGMVAVIASTVLVRWRLLPVFVLVAGGLVTLGLAHWG